MSVFYLPALCFIDVEGEAFITRNKRAALEYFGSDVKLGYRLSPEGFAGRSLWSGGDVLRLSELSLEDQAYILSQKNSLSLALREEQNFPTL